MRFNFQGTLYTANMESKIEKSSDVATDYSIRRGSVDVITKLENSDNDFEVFTRAEGAVDFRTVSWVHASMIFLKGWWRWPCFDDVC